MHICVSVHVRVWAGPMYESLLPTPLPSLVALGKPGLVRGVGVGG